MQVRILIDNNTIIDQYYMGEPGVCYLLEDAGTTLLFDTGYSDLYLRNAALMNIDLSTVSTLVLSHGHNDHTRGLKFFPQLFPDTLLTIVGHPDVFRPRLHEGLSIGAPCTQKDLATHTLRLSREPMQISKHCIFLGEIPAIHDFEPRLPMGTFTDDNTPDTVPDDSALVYQGPDGLFIITGCSHAGICNIIEYARKVCNDTRIAGVLGGFHLFELSPRLTETIRYFQASDIRRLYPCHCVSFAVKAEIHRHIPLQEVGVGMTISL